MKRKYKPFGYSIPHLLHINTLYMYCIHIKYGLFSSIYIELGLSYGYMHIFCLICTCFYYFRFIALNPQNTKPTMSFSCTEIVYTFIHVCNFTHLQAQQKKIIRRKKAIRDRQVCQRQ